jgi:hypothetical protein
MRNSIRPRRQIGVLSLERGLNLDGTIHRLDHTGEFSEDTIASGVDEAAAVTFDEAVVILR